MAVSRDITGWVTEVEKAERYFEKWRNRTKKTIDRYRDERGDMRLVTTRYNILWSNIETLRPAIYFQKPKPVVDRRFLDSDPVGRTASLIMERCLSYAMDKYPFDVQVNSAITDYMLCGRGVLRADFKANVTQVPDPMNPESTISMVSNENVSCLYWFWDDFVHAPARSWDKVAWIRFRSYLTRQQLVERFGEEVGNAVKLDYVPKDNSPGSVGSDNLKPPEDGEARACIWEIWYKPDRTVTWIAPGTPDMVLDKRNDPLGLSDFYPIPRPLYATLTNESLVPIPDFWQYQDQAIEVDNLTNRIAQITTMVNLKGLYAGSNDKLPQLLQAQGPQLIAVDDFTPFLEKGGIEKAIMWMPLDMIMKTLVGLYELRSQVKQDLNNISGVEDIAGNSEATATSQKIGSKYQALRLQEKQKEVARFLRDLLRIKAEIIAEHFSPETLLEMSGYEYMPGANKEMAMQAIKLLKDDKLRSFRIDIETDSMIAIDNEDNKEKALEFLGVLTPFLREAIPAVKTDPRMGPLMREILLFGARQFKAGRPLEAVLEQAMFEMQNIPAPNKPSEAEMQTKGQMQLQQMKSQGAMAETEAELQAGLIQTQADLQADLARTIAKPKTVQ